jgi:Tfp pilus assembly protein PilZ
MIADKRTIERFSLVLSASLKSAGAEKCDTFTRDISSQGAFVQTATPLALGEKVELAVTLPSGNNFLNAKGTVVRVELDGVAIQFNHPCIVPVSHATH